MIQDDLFQALPSQPKPGDRLRVLSLWQPWCSLCFAGAKLHETRSWQIPAYLYGRTIALHATAGDPPEGEITPELDALCARLWDTEWRTTLPRSAVIGTVRLAGQWPTSEIRDIVTSDDLASGIWTDGRWAWLLADPMPFDAPIPASGMQGIWRWTMPKGVHPSSMENDPLSR